MAKTTAAKNETVSPEVTAQNEIAQLWANGEKEADAPKVYLNVALQVAPDVTIRMPLNCLVATDIKGMNANQRKLMELLIQKVENATCDEDLVINAPAILTLYKQGSKEADTTGWTSL